MEIPIDSIHLAFYTGGLNQIGAGSLPGQGGYPQEYICMGTWALYKE